MTLSFVLPALVTLLAFAWAIILIRRQSLSFGVAGPFAIVAAFVLLIVAAFVSLLAWLGWLIWWVFA